MSAEQPGSLVAASESLRQQSIDLLGELIAFDTTSVNSNLQLISFVGDYLEQRGIKSRLTYDETGKKANLWATIGPDIAGGVVLSGHTDVVPVEDQSWSSDPFTMVARDNKLFGRGTADMKGFVACALAHTDYFNAPVSYTHLTLPTKA